MSLSILYSLSCVVFLNPCVILVSLNRRNGFFWRTRASLGLACAQATTLCSQVFGKANPRFCAGRPSSLKHTYPAKPAPLISSPLPPPSDVVQGVAMITLLSRLSAPSFKRPYSPSPIRALVSRRLNIIINQVLRSFSTTPAAWAMPSTLMATATFSMGF